MNCPICSAALPDGAELCPSCRTPVDADSPAARAMLSLRKTKFSLATFVFRFVSIVFLGIAVLVAGSWVFAILDPLQGWKAARELLPGDLFLIALVLGLSAAFGAIDRLLRSR